MGILYSRYEIKENPGGDLVAEFRLNYPQPQPRHSWEGGGYGPDKTTQIFEPAAVEAMANGNGSEKEIAQRALAEIRNLQKQSLG